MPWTAKSQKIYLDKLRADMIHFLGGRCKLCGFSDYRALQIDHIQGGGKQENKNKSQYQRLAAVYDNPKKYQLLCANCNWIKRSENKEVGKHPLHKIR